MSGERNMRPSKDSKRKAIGKMDRDAWAEVFAELDAAGVSDGFELDRDLRPAEERPVLDAFFDVRQH